MAGYPLDYFHNVSEADLASLDAYVRNVGCPDVRPELICEARQVQAERGRRLLSDEQRVAYARFVLAVRGWYTAVKSPSHAASASREERIAALKAWSEVSDPLAFKSWPAIRDDTDFDALIKSRKWTLVVFASSGCTASRIMGRAMEATRRRFSRTLSCYIAGINRVPRLAERFAIHGLPVFLLFKQGGLKAAQRGGGLATVEWLAALEEIVPLS